MCPEGSCGPSSPSQHLREGGSQAGVWCCRTQGKPLPRLRTLSFSKKRKWAKEGSPGPGIHTWGAGSGLLGPSSSRSPPQPGRHARAKPGTCPVPGGLQWGLLPACAGVWGWPRAACEGAERRGGGRPACGSPSAHTPQPNAPAAGANRCAPPSGRRGSSESASSGAGTRAREATDQDPRMPAGGNRSQSRATSQPRPRGVGASVPIPRAADPSLTRPDLTLCPDPVWTPGPAPVPTLTPLHTSRHHLLLTLGPEPAQTPAQPCPALPSSDPGLDSSPHLVLTPRA